MIDISEVVQHMHSAQVMTNQAWGNGVGLGSAENPAKYCKSSPHTDPVFHPDHYQAMHQQQVRYLAQTN